MKMQNSDSEYKTIAFVVIVLDSHLKFEHNFQDHSDFEMVYTSK